MLSLNNVSWVLNAYSHLRTIGTKKGPHESAIHPEDAQETSHASQADAPHQASKSSRDDRRSEASSNSYNRRASNGSKPHLPETARLSILSPLLSLSLRCHGHLLFFCLCRRYE